MAFFERRRPTPAAVEDLSGNPRRRAALVHREMLQLALLITAAVATFFLTRGVAAASRRTRAADADEWYRRGRDAMAADRLDAATDAFRRATTRRRGDPTYVLALARALALNGDPTAARRELMALRENSPEDPDVNLELARLAAARSDAADAQRFYYNALYAPWPAEQADARRRVRMELIRFLATHGQTSRALSELLAVSPDVPDDPTHQEEVARLFSAAGDHRRALGHFQRALALAPDDGAAVSGAGLEAFRHGDYPLARSYLRRAIDTAGEVAEAREIVELVLGNDPLAARLGASERRRRLQADVDHARARLSACPPESGGTSGAEVAALGAELQAIAPSLKPRQILDQDTVEAGLDAISHVEAYATQHCGPATPFDRALTLIAREHGSGAQ